MIDHNRVLSTLARAEVLVQGLQEQLGDNANCIGALVELGRVRALLDQAGILFLNHYIEECMAAQQATDREKLLRAFELLFRVMPAIRESDTHDPPSL